MPEQQQESGWQKAKKSIGGGMNKVGKSLEGGVDKVSKSFAKYTKTGQAIEESREALKTEKEQGQNVFAALASGKKNFVVEAQKKVAADMIFIILAMVGILPVILPLGWNWVIMTLLALTVVIVIALPTGRRKLAVIPLLILITMALMPWPTPQTGEIPQGLSTILLVIFFMSVITGLIGGRESRPALGVMVMVIAMVAFSYSYTDVVGMAVFGQYFPAIQAATEGITKPMSMAFDRGSCETDATWKCITEGPATCAQLKAKCERAQSEAVGTPEAVEIAETRLAPQTIQAPDGENTVYITLENRGDWDAKNVKVNLDSIKVNRVVYGTPSTATAGKVTDVSCIAGEKSGNTCIWELLPKYDSTKSIGGRAPASFDIKWDLRNSNPCTADTCDVGLYPVLTFKAAFSYDVKAAYAVDVRSKEELTRLLLAGETLAGEMARYSGGPVMASFWTPKYVQAGEPTTVTASLSNTRDGTVKEAVYCIYLPSQGIEIKTNDKRGSTTPENTDEKCTPIDGMTAVKCDMKTLYSPVDVEKASSKGDNSKVAMKECSFTMTADIGEAPQKRLDVIGFASYTYEATATTRVGPIVPPSP